MASIALVGGDGCGKSSLIRHLLESLPFSTRHLYMGVSMASTNVALPSSRLAAYIKARSRKRPSASRGSLRSVLRLGNRVAEETFRQLLSWWYQLWGHVVLYERHFVFDFCGAPPLPNARLADRLHIRFLEHFYPRPGLTIFLDAPVEVLWRRKQDNSPKFLETRRRAILQVGASTKNFVRVDASQPFEEVCAQVDTLVVEFLQGRAKKRKRKAAQMMTTTE